MDDAELAAGHDDRALELRLHATEVERRERARGQAAYRDAVDGGQEAVMQAAFDAGYRNAAEVGRACGALRGFVRAAAAVRAATLTPEWLARADAVLCDVDDVRLARVTEAAAALAVRRLGTESRAGVADASERAVDGVAALATSVAARLLPLRLEPGAARRLAAAAAAVCELLEDSGVGVPRVAVMAAVEGVLGDAADETA